MKRTISSIKDILRDPVTAKRLYVLTFAAALMVLVLTVKGPEEQGRLLTDNEGNLTDRASGNVILELECTPSSSGPILFSIQNGGYNRRKNGL